MMNLNVLIAEDDSDITELLNLYLSSENFNVLVADNGAEALKIVKEKDVSIILADLMMPEMNGYELIKAVREFSNIPIIILSAKNMDVDKILGLNVGADAYITKPFNPLEVVAYVKAVLRRFYSLGSDVEKEKENKIKVGELLLNTEKFTVSKNGDNIPLTSAEYKILLKLMSSPERIFTKAQLYECINGNYYESDDNTIMVHISNLRSKIENDPGNPQYIKTVRGLGYRIEDKKKKN